MINSIAIKHNFEILTNAPIQSLASADINWYWVDFNQPSEEEIMELDHTFHFHPLAIEDCVHKLQRPKLDYYEDYAFFVVHSLSTPGLSKNEVDFFVGANYIVSFHHKESPEIDQVWNTILHSKGIKKWDPYFVLYMAMNKIVDNYFPIVYQIEDDLNQIEDSSKYESMEKLLDHLFSTRHLLLNIWHTVIPMKDLLYRIMNSHHLKWIEKRHAYFSDIYDHLLRLSEMIEGNREITTDIRDSYLSLNSHQTNKVMKILTVITTIFMPLTLIVGIYGMNFSYMPELHFKYSYFIILGFMLVIGIGMFAWFKKKGWFD